MPRIGLLSHKPRPCFQTERHPAYPSARSPVSLQDAILRNLQVLAESSQRISSELRAEWPQVNWKRIAAFRNVLVHDYLGLDLDRIWEVTQRDIPELKKIVEKILG